MLCSGCGKDIPFAGQVCPYFQRDKSNDQETTVTALILGFGFSVLGYFLFGGFGLIIGFVVGCVIAFMVSGAGSSKPPEVRLTKRTWTESNDKSSEDRLRKLNDLRQKRLIDNSEHAARRKAILDEL